MSGLINPMDQIQETRANLGKTASSNVTDAEIDGALTAAEDTVLEDTGYNTLSVPPYQRPKSIRRLKILNAVAYLLIRFADKVDLRESILKEISRENKKITGPELADADLETLIEGMDYETFPLNQSGGEIWSGVLERGIKRFRRGTIDDTFVSFWR